MAKLIKFQAEGLKKISKGVQILAKAVIVTLGPKGRNVVIKKGMGSPLSTKDGVTVAKEIVLKDKFENMGAQLVKEAAAKTADKAGDGTTTAIVLAEAIFNEGLKSVVAGANPIELKRGIDIAVDTLVEALSKMSKKVTSQEEIKQIATISANNDAEIGALISKAMEKVGRDGTITMAEAKGIDDHLKVVEGMQFDKGYLSPYFITNAEKMSVEFSNGLVFVTDAKLSSAKDIVPILEAAQEIRKPLLIIADDVEGEALATLVVNKIKAGLQVCAVKAPAFGDRRKEMMKDIALVTRATFVSEEVGLSLADIEPSFFGSAKTITINKEETIIVDGMGDKSAIAERVTEIKNLIALSDSDYDKEKLRERLAKLSGGVAVLEIGAPTEAELGEKKMRVEDAMHATQAAAIEGVVPGGGVALIRASKSLDKLQLSGDQKIGLEIVRKAAYAPAIAIASNCGEQGHLVAEKISLAEGNIGYNGLTGQFEDLVKAGVLDPVLVTKSALRHAASISSMLLTISAMITDKPEPKQETPMPGGGMPMGGMGGMGGMMGGMGGMM